MEIMTHEQRWHAVVPDARLFDPRKAGEAAILAIVDRIAVAHGAFLPRIGGLIGRRNSRHRRKRERHECIPDALLLNCAREFVDGSLERQLGDKSEIVVNPLQ